MEEGQAAALTLPGAYQMRAQRPPWGLQELGHRMVGAGSPRHVCRGDSCSGQVQGSGGLGSPQLKRRHKSEDQSSSQGGRRTIRAP